MTGHATLPLIPTAVVGSHGKPCWWFTAVKALEHGDFGPADLEEMFDDAANAAIGDMETAGIDIITDGEVRRLEGEEKIRVNEARDAELIEFLDGQKVALALKSGTAKVQGELDAALVAEPVADAPAHFGDRIKTEIAKWAKVVHDANIKAE